MALFTIALLEVACGWLCSLLRFWKSFADDFCAVAHYCAFGSRMIFALLRTVALLEVARGWLCSLLRFWKSLADGFVHYCAFGSHLRMALFTTATLEVVCG
jgi:hypothetical protein